MKRLILTFIPLLLFSLSVNAQSISLDGSDYSEGFNSLAFDWPQARTLPNGWYLLETGDGADTEYGITNGGSATPDTYSLGSGNSTERALGSLRAPGSSFATQFGG